MAQKGVLLEAIRKLEINNLAMEKELRTISRDSQRGKELATKIARNDSMILDFKFRLTEE